MLFCGQKVGDNKLRLDVISNDDEHIWSSSKLVMDHSINLRE